ncbi:MAG: 3-isopropylmalate dehydratase [SAR324 cluster bacterium]|nr:3-isopropylmalate dehydratase [SAR324 cluster bacterium]
MSIVIKGKVWKFGGHINTDYMAPSFSKELPWEEQKKTIMHVHKEFVARHQPGDVIVAGDNFGCGSSRESAPTNLKRLGIGCVVAESFGRIFFRNSIAIAFPVLVCEGVSQAFMEGEELELDFAAAVVRNLSQGKELKGMPLSGDLVNIVAAGGILSLLSSQAQA